MKTKKVLILTATFGMGHHAVSRAIKDEIYKANLNGNVDIVDLFDIINPSLKKALQKGYNVLTRDFEELYNFFYDYKSSSKRNLLDGFFYVSYQKKFNAYMALEKPDIVISTFPMTSGFMSRYKQQTEATTHLITVITDVVDSWEWIHEGTDRYFVPSVEVKDRLRLKGVPASDINVTGIPVREAFKQTMSREPKQTKKVLIMSSAMGKIKIDDAMLEKLSRIEDIHFDIVTGTDAALYDILKNCQYENITVHGFVQDIASLMSSADLIYTKPGGVTLFEAINAALPLLVQANAVGQEHANIEFIQSRQIGAVIHEPEHFISILKTILADDYRLLQYRSNMHAIQREFETDALVSAISS